MIVHISGGNLINGFEQTVYLVKESQILPHTTHKDQVQRIKYLNIKIELEISDLLKAAFIMLAVGRSS